MRCGRHSGAFHLVIQTEQQRSERLAIVTPSEADHDTVCCPLVLDFDPGPLAMEILLRPLLGDHAVQPCTFEVLEPLRGHHRVTSYRRQQYLSLSPASNSWSRSRRAPRGRSRKSSVPSARRSNATQVTGVAGSEQAHSRLSWVNSELQRFEIETVLTHDDELAVEDDPVGIRKLRLGPGQHRLYMQRNPSPHRRSSLPCSLA
jgi:hypothetical protein